MEVSRERFVDCSVSRVFVRENREPGAGTPVVFLHGLGSAGSIYDPAFGQEFLRGRVVCLDFPGFGKSGKPFDFSYTLGGQAAVLREALDGLGIGKADLVAHSMGGVVSILFAESHPERVGRLVTAEANLDPAHAKISRRVVEYGSEERFEAAFESFVAHYKRPNVPAAYRFYRTLSQCTWYSLYRSAASILSTVDDSLRRRYFGLRVPRYFLRGEASYHGFDAGKLRDLAEAGIPLLTVPRAGHSMMEDEPDAFYAALRGILDAPFSGTAP